MCRARRRARCRPTARRDRRPRPRRIPSRSGSRRRHRAAPRSAGPSRRRRIGVAAIRICCAALGSDGDHVTSLQGASSDSRAGRNVREPHSMLALGAQQPREPVALLLRSAAREHFVQMVVRSSLWSPDAREMADHHPHLRLHAVLEVVIAQEPDHLPMRRRELQVLAPRECAREILGPLRRDRPGSLRCRFRSRRPPTSKWCARRKRSSSRQAASRRVRRPSPRGRAQAAGRRCCPGASGGSRCGGRSRRSAPPTRCPPRCAGGHRTRARC